MVNNTLLYTQHRTHSPTYKRRIGSLFSIYTSPLPHLPPLIIYYYYSFLLFVISICICIIIIIVLYIIYTHVRVCSWLYCYHLARESGIINPRRAWVDVAYTLVITSTIKTTRISYIIIIILYEIQLRSLILV